ncbi:YihY/virulence factor BrkB family protein [Roseococcus sp. YIM B11640]|uniref:YihY/virulence factor BrkB family protein n=1 Tax=Roseococcus sp. YIM B11640 TaxID=3133973 RepID=UPI003C7A605B
MLARAVTMAKDIVNGFLEDEALTRAAAIAYFALFSLGPLLFLITGLAGVVFGEQEVKRALAEQITGLIGTEAGGAVQGMAQNALGDAKGGWALALGVATLTLTASGAFGALQSALNAIWRTETPPSDAETTTEAITHFVRAKALSLGLVGTTGFLLLVSLVVSAALSTFQNWLSSRMPGLDLLLGILNFSVSLIFITLLFAAIYKILPDRRLHWRDVLVGAFATALLFSFGKTAIAVYIGSSGAAEGFGAAGSLAIILLWLYYSAVIFLLGAEFTRAWSGKEPTTIEAAAMVGAPPPAPKGSGALALDGTKAREAQLLLALTGIAAILSFMRRGRRA